MEQAKQIESIANFLGVLGDETRLSILYLLRDGHKVSKQIQETLNKAQSTISQHLKILRKVNLIDYEQSGAVKKYYVKDRNIFKLLKNISYYIDDLQKLELERIEERTITDTLT